MKSIRDMDAGELQRLIGSREEPMKLRNAAAKRFKALRKAKLSTHGGEKGREDHFSRHMNPGDL